MKITFKIADLIKALDVVSIVAPQPVTAQGGSGYLFVVRGNICHLYSRDALCVARAEFPVSETDGDGSFAYPSEYVSAFKYLATEAETCTMEATSEEERFVVKYKVDSGAKAERSSFNPELLSTCDDDLQAVKTEHAFPAGLLREGIRLARPFLPEINDTKKPEHLKGLQVMDASRKEYEKGDGYLFVSDGARVFYFHCEALKGKALEIHSQHLPLFVNFLGKSGEKVTIRKGDHFNFAVSDNGSVFGWPRHSKLHDKFNYFALKSDKYVLQVHRARLLNSLMLSQVELGPNREKVKVNFDPERRALWFTVTEGTGKAEGLPVQVTVKETEDKPWSASVNINQFIEMVNNVKGNEVELRVLIVPADETTGRKEMVLFRSIDDFHLDSAGKVTPDPEGAFKCRVTRFMPSMA